jgi:tRNA1(Val) A37 N6-methylase TrmN6
VTTAPAERTTDAFLGGLVALVQPREGHRAGLDAALLQALVPADAEGRAVDLGAGVGTVAFAVAARVPGLRVTAVEREAALVACARDALALPANAGFADRVNVVEGDVTASLETLGLAERSADWVLLNPPFDAAGKVRASPDQVRARAHVAEPGALAAWRRTAAALARPGGTLGLIHRAAALDEVLETLADGFGDIRILPVHPARDQPAGRILVRARRESRAGLQLLPGLALHRPGGAWTEEADAILRGRMALTL